MGLCDSDPALWKQKHSCQKGTKREGEKIVLIVVSSAAQKHVCSFVTFSDMKGMLSLFSVQTAYMAASLLIDPKSELTILLTATIQADLKSDNFLTGEYPGWTCC